MTAGLSIGRLADEAGVNVETIRYYQRRRLLAEPVKPPNGHRRYAAELVKRVRFIKRAQALGFTLNEIAGLLELHAPNACTRTLALATRKLDIIERKLADLAAMRKALAALMRQCETGRGRVSCPIIRALTKD